MSQVKVQFHIYTEVVAFLAIFGVILAAAAYIGTRTEQKQEAAQAKRCEIYRGARPSELIPTACHSVLDWSQR